ncbi:type VI secretion system ATPase TssH [Psychromonas sp. Urea-02u-13]|uniref:type VI secretion system ATPase TssH n=1 Tax=Psychromonas sp. Urea-02u-13 TaxID=2058326 RepID=UPI000C3253CF|nr:type VI secretion system ATPase TssH [Psychromonas sp. Urea-02u-13]PKG38763.1 type VI secretion system ATPase TssH [Psychromonas sp. Urea-02u-13]
MVTIDLKSLVGRLNETSRNAMEGAAGICLARTHYNVEIEHWLLKLLEVRDSDIVAILEKFDVDLGRLTQDLNRELDRIKGGNTRAPALSPTLVDISKNAWMLASVEYGQPVATSAHILTALLLDDTLRQTIGALSGELKKIKPESLREVTRAIVGTTAESAGNMMGDTSSNNNQASATPSNTPSLDKFTVNLTDDAKKGKIDPILGRDEEIRQIIDILIRRRQNNPILTGEAGVGKTAVVEGFALRIASGDVPEALKDVSVRSLDLGLLQAGASVKGEFENRLKSVISEVKASPQPIIMFIDEAHTLIGAGGKEGQGDAANLLKPALARGELRTIAATTWAEYKKYFERDPALTRRFQVVKIEEPSEEKAINMMRAMAGMLQNHHGVNIMDEAIIDSVKLSSRYITSRQLPDKSVSLLDTACARVSLSQSATPESVENTRRNITQTTTTIKSLEREHAAHGNHQEKIDELTAMNVTLAEKLAKQEAQWKKELALVSTIHGLQKQIEDSFTAKEKNDLVSTQEKTAETDQALLTDDVLIAIKQELQAQMTALTELQGDEPMIQVNVGAQAIAEVVANWTGIPVGKMVSNEIQAIMNLKDTLQKRIIGQDHALEAIAECIKTSRAGLTDPRKPIGVFFMVGSSGIGKTETALALADELYGGEQNITCINMSEFKEEHKVSMLLGSPPGYVGYGEGGVLTEAARRKPHSIILLDEMEKAHPGVQDIFYNLFDKGTIKDGEGRDIDFRNTVIIMTSNAAEEHIRAICEQSETLPDPDVLLDNFRPQLLNYFKPAFLGRTTVIPYYPLGDENLLKICKINMNRIAKRVKEHYNASFSYDEDVMLHILARSQEVDTGARNIENILTRTLLPEMAVECLTKMSKDEEITHINVNVCDQGLFSYDIS